MIYANNRVKMQFLWMVIISIELLCCVQNTESSAGRCCDPNSYSQFVTAYLKSASESDVIQELMRDSIRVPKSTIVNGLYNAMLEYGVKYGVPDPFRSAEAVRNASSAVAGIATLSSFTCAMMTAGERYLDDFDVLTPENTIFFSNSFARIFEYVLTVNGLTDPKTYVESLAEATELFLRPLRIGTPQSLATFFDYCSQELLDLRCGY